MPCQQADQAHFGTEKWNKVAAKAQRAQFGSRSRIHSIPKKTPPDYLSEDDRGRAIAKLMDEAFMTISGLPWFDFWGDEIC